MFKLYDFSCMNEDCEKYQQIIELLLGSDEKAVCEACDTVMPVALTYAAGYVAGGSPRYHKNSRPK